VLTSIWRNGSAEEETSLNAPLGSGRWESV